MTLIREAVPGAVPLDRYPVLRPDHYGARDVYILRMAQRDIRKAPNNLKPQIEAALEDLRRGRARIEPKERPPLIGSYTIRVNNKWRIGLYLTEDQPSTPDPHPDWIVYWCGSHNYSVAEQRMRNNQGYTRNAMVKLAAIRGH